MYDFFLNKICLSPRGRKLLVFNFHNIHEEGDNTGCVGVSHRIFQQQLQWITDRFEVLPLIEAIVRCKRGELEKPSACLTFDDGYRTQKTIASQLLLELGVSGAFFVTSGHLGKSILWNDWFSLFKNSASAADWRELSHVMEAVLPGAGADLNKVSYTEIERRIKYLSIKNRQRIIEVIRRSVPVDHLRTFMMSEYEIRELYEAGFEIGAHTLMHPILTLESNREARLQIVTDLSNIRSIVGADVRCFAFPNGLPGVDYDATHLEILSSEKIEIALTSAFGHFDPLHDALQVPRVSLQGESELGYLRTVRSAYRTLNTPLSR